MFGLHGVNQSWWQDQEDGPQFPLGQERHPTHRAVIESQNCFGEQIKASSPITSWQKNGETMETVTDYFLRLQNHCRWWLQPWNEKTLAPWKENYDKPTQCIIKQRHHFANKGPYGQSYGLSNSHVWMWELDHKEGWEPKNWCFWAVVLEKTLKSSLDSQEIKPIHPKGNQSILKEISPKYSLEGLMLKLKLQYFGHLMQRVDSLEKTLMLGGIGGRRRRWRQDEMAGWHHRLDGHAFE